ncbi:class I SAM-dependent methyltransferase [Acinetobacter colistiniresistens]|uniref:Class I SAM-dependent methyltransferase n=1 Tax=Acinetobacter colistiniresistens TaxID=280145 RepID=A0A558F9P3_9GAMM|nr:class I SAM-dependent methyltransferase [Acinetobacter colistiniresistens]TVT82327.1 class I SAM-dependent methyltransferase [Acinetobacter colistiniresistens]
MNTQHQVNQQQYQNKSQAYLNSTVHAQGIEFAKMQHLIQSSQLKKVLDLGCGGGHISYQIAAFADQVTAYDLTPSMVELVAEQAKQKGFDNITVQQGAAESLPFADQSFDCVMTRYSAHHWQNVAQAMAEIHRVLAPQGKVIIVDILGHSNPVMDTFFQTIETIRDPSHVRNYSLQEWMRFAEYAGFRIETVEKQHLDLEFTSWTARMQTPEYAIQTIRDLQKKASDQTQQYYRIQADGSFSSEVVYLVLSRCGQ